MCLIRARARRRNQSVATNVRKSPLMKRRPADKWRVNQSRDERAVRLDAGERIDLDALTYRPSPCESPLGWRAMLRDAMRCNAMRAIHSRARTGNSLILITGGRRFACEWELKEWRAGEDEEAAGYKSSISCRAAHRRPAPSSSSSFFSSSFSSSATLLVALRLLFM